MESTNTTLDSRVEALDDIIIHRMAGVGVSLIEARLEVIRDPARPFSEADRYRLVSAATDLVGIANKVLALAETGDRKNFPSQSGQQQVVPQPATPSGSKRHSRKKALHTPASDPLAPPH